MLLAQPNRILICLGLLLTLLLTSCGNQSGTTYPSKTSTPSNKTADALENDLLAEINHYRAQQGLVPLRANRGLTKLAREHSQAMVARNEMGHFDFEKRMKAARANENMARVSENLHRTPIALTTGDFITKAWIHSPVHQKNLVGPFTSAGVGVAQDDDEVFATLFLGQLRSQTPPSSFLIF